MDYNRLSNQDLVDRLIHLAHQVGLAKKIINRRAGTIGCSLSDRTVQFHIAEGETSCGPLFKPDGDPASELLEHLMKPR